MERSFKKLSQIRIKKEILLREEELMEIKFDSTIKSLIMLLNFKKKDIEDIKIFYNYIFKLKYNHPGLNKKLYMMHPIRVAKFVAKYSKNFTSNDIMLALSHNILEVTNINEKKIANNHLQYLLPYLKILNVDRKLENNQNYKVKYYNCIKEFKITSTIKILDKLDNLYLLKNNPNKEIKLKYLNEINQFIIPLAEFHLPICVELIRELMEYNMNLIKGNSVHEI